MKYKLLIIIPTVLILSMGVFAYKNMDSSMKKYVIKNITEGHYIQVWMNKDATEEEVNILGNELRAMPELRMVRFVSREETANKQKELINEYHNSAEAIEAEYFSDSYIVELNNRSQEYEVVQKIQKLDYCRKVTTH